jgi:hypothetical protein
VRRHRKRVARASQEVVGAERETDLWQETNLVPEGVAIGELYITERVGDPATWLGYGTWDLIATGSINV